MNDPVQDAPKNSNTEVISLFMDKAVWLCRKSPAAFSGSQIGEWLVYCIKKGSDDASVQADKSKAINTVLKFFGLLQRKDFEDHLIKFIKNFSHQSPLRARQCSSRIENGTDWERTYLKTLAESGGRLCSFVNYSRTAELDHISRSSLLLLAWDMGCELRNFADLISGVDQELENVFRKRADALLTLSRNAEQQMRHYYSERTEYVLRRTPEGGRLADEINRWIFTPQWLAELPAGQEQTGSAAQLLKKLVDEKKINSNDLFEVVATIIGIQTLTCDMEFEISKCNIDHDKPAVELTQKNGNIHCRIQKNFDTADNIDDKLIDFRRVASQPTGHQPDIVYKFWRKDDSSRQPVFLLGDAKNYRSGAQGKINYPDALYAMMHYLIAFRDALQIDPDDVVPLLDCNAKLQKSFPHQRIVLFFPAPDQVNDDPYPQPGRKDIAERLHPILFVYVENSLQDLQSKNLKQFFENALAVLDKAEQ